MKTLAFLSLLIASGLAAAQSPSPATSREIEQLFSALGNSKCEFSRNDAWYDAAKATEHLRRKYDYLRRKGLVTSAESFIDLAATRSSMSGKPYLVRCDNAAPIASKAWFAGKLKALRAASTR